VTIISLFHCSPAIIRDTPSLGDDLRAHGINTLEMQVYRSPANDPDYPTWEREWEKSAGAEIDWCVREGWDYVGRLDDAVRTVPEREAMCQWPGTVLHVAARTGDSKRCVGIEVCDEMAPQTGTYPVHQLAALWRHKKDCPPLAYPGWAPQQYERSWIAGYCSRQWDWWNRKSYASRLHAVKNALTDLPNDNRPVSLLWPIVAEWYSERDGIPGPTKGDVKWNKGMTPKGLYNLAMAAVKIVGKRQLRLRGYGYDYPGWVAQRATGRTDERGRLQTGAGPHVDRKRWRDILGVCREIAGLASR
jgi:hypothetical protein